MKSRTLVVRAPRAFVRGLIAQSLPRFLHEHPRLRVVMCDSNLADHPLAHDTDLAICIGQIADRTLVATEIGAVRWITCASPDYIECMGVPSSPADIDPDQCIAVLESGTHSAQQWRFCRQSQTCAVSPAALLTFSDCDSAIAAAVRGGGYVRVLSIEAEHHVAAGLLLPVLTSWNDVAEPVAMVHARDCGTSEKILAFRSFMASILPAAALTAG